MPHDPLWDKLLSDEDHRAATAKRAMLRSAGDAERFRLWFAGPGATGLAGVPKGPLTLDRWRDFIDTVLNLKGIDPHDH